MTRTAVISSRDVCVVSREKRLGPIESAAESSGEKPRRRNNDPNVERWYSRPRTLDLLTSPLRRRSFIERDARLFEQTSAPDHSARVNEAPMAETYPTTRRWRPAHPD